MGNEPRRRRWFIFGIAPRVPLSSVRFRSEDGVGSDTDAAAARCALVARSNLPAGQMCALAGAGKQGRLLVG